MQFNIVEVEINILVTLLVFVCFIFHCINQKYCHYIVKHNIYQLIFDEDLPYDLKICLLKKSKSRIEMKYGMKWKAEVR